MRFDQCLEQPMMGHIGPEMEMHFKPKAVVFDYLKTESYTKPQCVCMRVCVCAHARQLTIPAGFVKNIEAVVKGRVPTWKEIAWQSPLVVCMVRVGVIACACFLWAAWTCAQNTWHTRFVWAPPGLPRWLVLPSPVFRTLIIIIHSLCVRP